MKDLIKKILKEQEGELEWAQNLYNDSGIMFNAKWVKTKKGNRIISMSELVYNSDKEFTGYMVPGWYFCGNGWDKWNKIWGIEIIYTIHAKEIPCYIINPQYSKTRDDKYNKKFIKYLPIEDYNIDEISTNDKIPE